MTHIRSTLRAVVVALGACGAVLVATPAYADTPSPVPSPVPCDDGGSGSGVVGGNNPGSDCETQVAFYESLGCTVGYSDTPNGPEDTLTVDCSAGTPQSEYESPNTAAVSPTLRRGNGNKANPPVLRQVQQSFTCTSFSQGIGTAGYHTEESERICNASLTRQVDAWADRVYNVATVSGKFTNVRSTTRCNEANLLSYVREFGPAFAIVSTTGDVACTTIVYANRVDG